jgi:hypothetical protein
MKKEKDYKKYWTAIAVKVLEGKTIAKVRYLNDKEMKQMGWYKRPICFFLNDGTSCILSMDDEGNDGGVLFYQNDSEKNGVIPVI